MMKSYVKGRLPIQLSCRLLLPASDVPLSYRSWEIKENI